MFSLAKAVEPRWKVGDALISSAQMLARLHDGKAVFDFCGGMMFQMVLSSRLRAHLGDENASVIVHGAEHKRMDSIQGYTRSSFADNRTTFYGREVRKVPHAKGGHGFVLQLVFAGGEDPEGWSDQEIKQYDGWGHDSSRQWRRGDMLESEGVKGFRSAFGDAAYTLNHRFYLHTDSKNQLWLSAEDGCEGKLVQ